MNVSRDFCQKALSILAGALLVGLVVLGMTGCVTTGAGTGSPVTIEQMRAGAAYLDSTLTTVSASVAAAKIKYPEKAAHIEQDIEPVLTELRAATAAFKAALAAQDVEAGASSWATARALVTSLISAAMPYLIGAIL